MHSAKKYEISGSKKISAVRILQKICLFFLFLGLIITLISAIFLCLLSKLINWQILKAKPLQLENPITKLWLDPPYEMYVEFRFFNFTNPEGYQSGYEIPAVIEVGPYVYRMWQEKRNITVSNDTNIISYDNYKFFEFLPGKSTGSENDMIKIPNIVLLAFYNGLIKLSEVSRNLGAILFGVSPPLFVDKSVRELLFEGYEDPLLDTLRSPALFSYVKKQLPDKVGFYYNKNGTSEGRFSVYTGKNDPSQTGKLASVDGNSTLYLWHSDFANQINGTVGDMFKPFIQPADNLSVFSKDLMRTLRLKYEGATEIKQIPAFSYSLPGENFNSTLPENAGFCQHNTDFTFGAPNISYIVKNLTEFGNCLLPGLLNGSVSTNDLPIVYSFPHFLYSSWLVRSTIRGVNPNESIHQSMINIEPKFGALLSAETKMQVNVAVNSFQPKITFPPLDMDDVYNGSHVILQPIELYSATERVAPEIIPIFWINQSILIDNKTAKLFYDELIEKRKVAYKIAEGATLGGALLAFCSLMALFLLSRTKAEKK